MNKKHFYLAVVLIVLILLSVPLAGMAEQQRDNPQIPESNSETVSSSEDETIATPKPQPEVIPEESQGPQDGTPDNLETPSPSDGEQPESENPAPLPMSSLEPNITPDVQEDDFESIQNTNTIKSLTMDARTTTGNLTGESAYNYELSAGVTVSSASIWSANSGLTNSEGEIKTLYTGSGWIKYYPNQSGAVLDYGIYDIYYWFPYHEQNAGINLNAEIYSNGRTKQIPCSALVQNAGSGTDSRWVKIGSFDFRGDSNEYLKLSANGFARVADVKFVKTGVRMDIRTTVGNIPYNQSYDYDLGPGVTVGSPTHWSANSGLRNSQGELKTVYSTGGYAPTVQFNPNLAGDGLVPGTYDIYFWNLYHDTYTSVNMSADVNANGNVTHLSQADLDEAAGNMIESKWVKIGTFDLTGADEEYLKFTGIGLSHVADVKFVKTDLHMDVRSTVGQRWGEESYTYDLSDGVSISSKNEWSANSSLRNSQGFVRTLYTGNAGKWVQFNPNQIGSSLENGDYDVYFWFVYNNQNAGIHLDAEVKANGQVYQVPCSDLLESAGNGMQSRWVKIGRYQFSGASDEYLKLISTGFARIGDVKFIKAGQSGQSGEEEIDVPILLRETTPVLVTIGFQNRTTLADVVFCVSYNESNCTLTDFCALTEEKEQNTGLIQGGNVEILSHTFNAMTNRKELRFKSAKTIPPGKMMSGVANIVKFQGTAGAQINESIKISVETEGAGA